MLICFFTTFLFVVNSCNSFPYLQKNKLYDVVEINGVIQYFFELDNVYHYYGNKYSPLNSTSDYQFQDSDYNSSISLECNYFTLNNVLNSYEGQIGSIFSSNHLLSQDTLVNEAGYYYGGDIYYSKGSNNIVIAFNVKGLGILFHRVCEKFLDYENFRLADCSVQEKILTPPFITLLRLDSTLALTKEQLDSLGIIKANISKFPVEYCH